MNESIDELRSVIRRLRPHLVLRPSTDPENFHRVPGQLGDTRCERGDGIANDEFATKPINVSVDGTTRIPSSSKSSARAVTAESLEASNAVEVMKEIQLEASSELVDALSSFIWILDSLWSDELNSTPAVFAVEHDLGGGIERDASDSAENRLDIGSNETGKGTVNRHNEKQCEEDKLRNKSITGISTKANNSNSTILEPDTVWNDDSKSLVREGYGLILSSFSTFYIEDSRINSLDKDYVDDNDKNHLQNAKDEEATRSLVRNSILQLLPTLATSACRHFLLGFLPHFMPLEMNYRQGCSSIHGIVDWSPPSWLLEDLNKEECMNGNDTDPTPRSFIPNIEEDTTLNNSVTQLLETFQSLISIDPSTLAPFLSILSVIFDNFPLDRSGDPTTDGNGNIGNDANTTTQATRRDDARKYCFELCLSSLPSISEHDLPSLLHSLFVIVRNRNEGHQAMKALRQEWVEVCACHHGNHNEFPLDGQTDVTSAAYIGNVIVRCMLSDHLPGSSCLAAGFLDAVTDSLCLHHSSSNYNEQQRPNNTGATFHFTGLDLIIMVALYPNRKHRLSVEEIVEELMCRDDTSILKLSNGLIKSWSPVSTERPIHQKTCVKQSNSSLLYDLLSSPLISLMFYMLMTPTSLKDNRNRDQFLSIIHGGILSYHYNSASRDTTNFDDKVHCCEVFSNLYFAVDPRRQEQITSSLLAMMSESFVSSHLLDPKRTRYRKKSQNGKHHAHLGVDNRTKRLNLQLSLFSASAACRVLMLICRRDASHISQIKGILLDRILSFASMTQPTSSNEKEGEEEGYSVTYILFDMNCALLMAMLFDNSDEEDGTVAQGGFQNISTDHHGSVTSELLIICQKLLFSDNMNVYSSSSKQPRAVCGLILASRLLRCKNISRSDRGNVWNWVLAILSAAPLFSSDTQSKQNVIAPIQSLDPVIAHWGLSFLKFASSTISCRSEYPEISQLVESSSICGHNDVFRQVNKMLATAAIVQMEDALRLPVSENGVLEGQNAGKTFLAYGKVPEYFITQSPSRKRRTAASPGMVMSVPYFLYGTLSNVGPEVTNAKSADLPSIYKIASYAHDLVDEYLELGRRNCSDLLSSKNSSWNPRGWLMAKIQLPCCLPLSLLRLLGMGNNRLELDCRETHFCAHNSVSPVVGCKSNITSHQSSTGAKIQNRKWKALFVEVLKESSNQSRLVQNMVEFSNCLVVSIGASIAVLKHAHSHYLDQYMNKAKDRSHLFDENQGDPKPSDGANKIERRKKKQEEGLKKLVQFQLAKIFDMQRLCRTLHSFLEAIHFEPYIEFRYLPPKQPSHDLTQEYTSHEGRGVRTSQLDLTTTKESNASTMSSTQVFQNFNLDYNSNLASIKLYLDSSARSITNSIFWGCLLDDVDDLIVRRGVELLVNEESNDISKSSSTASQSTAPAHIALFVFQLRRKVIHELQQNIIHQNHEIPSHGILYPPDEGDVTFTRLGIDGLTLPEFSKLFCSTLSFTSQLSQLGRIRKSMKRLEESYSIMHNYVFSLYKLLLTIFSITVEDDKSDLIQGEQKFDHKRNFSTCFREILRQCTGLMSSYMTVPGETGDSSSSIEASVILIEGVLLRQLELCEDASILCLIVDLLSIILIHSNCSRANLAKITHVAVTSVYTTGDGRVNLPYAFFSTVHMIIDQAQHTIKSKENFVTTAFSNFLQIANTLQKSKDSETTTFVHLILSHWSSAFLDKKDLRSYLQLLQDSVRVVLTKRKSNDFESCASPLPIVSTKNVILLFELVLHMIVSSLTLYDPPHIKRSIPTFREGPYDEFISLLEFYSNSIFLFQTNSVLFPQREFFQVTKTSLVTIKLCEYQLQRCVEWRNLCRTLSDVGPQGDLGSPDLLQSLVNSIATNCVGTIASFCSSVNKCNSKDPMRFIKNGGQSFTYRHSKVIAELIYWCERLKETLSSICQVQHLTTPFSSESIDKCRTIKRRFGSDGRGMETKYRRLDGRKIIRSVLENTSDREQDDPLANDSDYQNNEEEVVMTNETDDNYCNNLDDESFASGDNESFGVVGDWGY